MTSKRWILAPQRESVSAELSTHLECSEILAQILLNRNLNTLPDVQTFLASELAITQHFPPETLDPCVDTISDAISSKKKVLIYGDYDVDGITSTTLMTSILRELGLEVSYYVPNRFTDGYGLNASIINRVRSGKFDLLITLDCGISNYNEISQLKEELGTSVLIFDHHQVPDKRPPADGIVNPKDLNESHPMWNLCTVGVVYIFCEYLVKKLDAPINMSHYLDLAALGTIADIVPLVGTNRSLVTKGLFAISARKRYGIHFLLEVAEFKRPYVTTRDVAFVIAPRLNSAGRLKHALMCIDLLLEKDPDKAQEHARYLNRLNDERRGIGREMNEDAVRYLTETPHELESKIIVLSSPRWHSGVIGITAAQLVERFNLPAVIMSVNDGIVKGSARSVGEVNIYKLLKECTQFFKGFGGHKNAAGFSLAPENVADFKAHLQSVAKNSISDHDIRPILSIDMPLDAQHLTLDMAKELERLEPHGCENDRPVFYSNQFKAVDFKRVGDGTHLKATLSSHDGRRIVDAIGFGLADKLECLYKPQLEIAFHLDINSWMNQEKLQLQLIDIK
jgi:single-stranded-DNA-specific exonuclease